MNFTDNEMIKRYLKHFSHSKASMKMRKSALNHFTKRSVKPISSTSTNDLIDYFDYLNSDVTISLSTKKNKWNILKSFLNFIAEYYNLNIIIPKYSIKWSNVHKKPNSHSDEVFSIEEISQILLYLKKTNFKYYLIFRIYTECGCRKAGVLNLKYTNVDLENRFFETKEKTGIKCYYFSPDVQMYLKLYINERKRLKTNNEFLFLNSYYNQYSERYFNIKLKEILNVLGIQNHLSIQNFRSTLNTLRYSGGCPLEICKILIGHKINDVTMKHYTKLSNVDFLNYFDTYNPFKSTSL
jgi:integrase